MRVFLHASLGGIVFGNGGYIALASLYEELTRIGHSACFFDINCDFAETLRLVSVRPQAQYLDCDDLCVTGIPFFRRDKGVIISIWMTDEFHDFITQNNLQKQLIFWDHGQMLRQHKKKEAGLVLSLLNEGSQLWLSNRYLLPMYKKNLGLEQAECLDVWARDHLFYYNRDEKLAGVVGYQPQSKRPHALTATEYAERHVEDLLHCTGPRHSDVAEKMRQCDIFFWYSQKDEGLYPVNGQAFRGESNGLAILEALTCGCVVVTQRNPFTQQIFPSALLCDSLEEGVWKVKRLQQGERKNILRQACLEIAENYRFNGFGGNRKWVISQGLHQATPA